MRLLSTLLAATLLTALPALTPAPAHACGGTFCDIPPPNQPPMPVDQSGENILFVVENNRVEAHVQIQYTGNPERFAWVVPMPKKPKISAGSQALFDRLLQGTVPTFQVQNTAVTGCNRGNFSDSGGGIGCGASGDSLSTNDSAEFFPGTSNGAAGGGQPSGPQVIARASVGSYETVTLGGGTADELLGWLNENNYLIPDTTSQFLKDYLEQQFVFVAVKLTAGAGLDEIHPLVFSYDGDQPCVPLKLTAVAAVENMGVRTFFLGSERFAPKNYKHVVVNELKFDWTAASGAVSNAFNPIPGQNQGRQINYKEVITEAVDSPIANGRAFVTEYAGTSAVVSGANIADLRWNSTPFKSATPVQAIQLLRNQGLLNCTGTTASATCTSPSPLLFPLLTQVLPPPLGVNPGSYYACPTCYPDAPSEGWSGEYFALELEERIFGPARHAEDILKRNPYLTRMFTTISPAEMIEDPEFVRTPRADVSLTHTATQQRQCDLTNVMVVGSDEVYLQNDNTRWPDLPAAMPAALRIEEYKDDGSVIVLRDNTGDIKSELAAFNKARSWPPEPEFTTQEESTGCSLGFGPTRGRTTTQVALGLAAAALLLRRRRAR
jgi:hypothetical protein